MNPHAGKMERLHANAEWIPVASSLGSLCNAWAKRHDLTVYLGSDGGQGKAPAFFDPENAEIEVNSTLAFGDVDPSLIGDLVDRSELSQYPVAGGVSLHEAMHARHTSADWSRLYPRFPSDRAWSVFKLLEETRVEKRGVDLFPDDAGYLRASTKALILGDDVDSGSPRFSAQVIYGRFAVGVLTEGDVAPVVAWLKSNGWSADLLERIKEIILDFAACEDNGPGLERQIELALELDALMPVDPVGNDEDGEGEPSSAPSPLADAIESALGRAERGAVMDVQEAADRAEAEAERQAAEASAATAERNQQKADQIFRTSDGSDAPIPSELYGSRQPTGDERAAAVELARSLEFAKYRDREVMDYWSEIPPGRLHGGEAMRLAAARWAGAPTQGFKPFKKRKRLETDEPRLTVGIMCDTSGSMESLQPSVGSATWVISDAVYRLDKAEAAQVYFGRTVKPGLRRGERQQEVRTWTGGGAYEDFDNGFRALDGELTLLHGDGARLLFVISDGEFKRYPGVDQIEACNRWLKTCNDNGVAVVWIQLRGQNYLTDNPGVEVVTVDPKDLLSTTREIGEACVRTMARVSGVDSGGW